MRRLPVLSLLLALALLLSVGCGTRAQIRTEGETEGLHVQVGELLYQVQLSRQLNASDPEDSTYLRGFAPGTTPPGPDETWFGVFIRVQNVTGEEHEPAETFEIVDTEERVYRPLVLDTDVNPFAYEPNTLGPGEILPESSTLAGQGPIRGALTLFKVKIESLQNRPLEYVIRSAQESGEAIIDLDV